MNMNLKTRVKEAGQIFKMYQSRLNKLGIETLEDLIYHIPFRYDDLSLISKIEQIQSGEIVTIQGKVISIKNQFTKKGKKIQKAKVSDETGEIDVIWFNQPYLVKIIHEEDTIALSGRVNKIVNDLIMESPEYEFMNNSNELIHTGRLVPIYPETKGLSSKWLRRQIYKLIKTQTQNILEHIPDSIRDDNNLMEIKSAIEQIHFPESLDMANKARLRLAFDELFLIQLASYKRRNDWEKNLKSSSFNTQKYQDQIQKLIKNLPFELTNAQKKAIDEIFLDLSKEKPMNRLLEGDVGSGKTVVAAIAMYLAYLNGFQSVLMAPTEILANQHYQTISNLLSPLGVKVELVTGNKKLRIKKQESEIKRKNLDSKFMIHDSSNNFNILIGTHALLSEKIKFERLGLVVIDEQQRFGVEQRAIIREKGQNPHLLTMTATPIPRTVALTLYGDLDLSYLNEMPKNRKKIKTWLVPSQKRDNAYKWIGKQIKETDSQVFIICPFIEESENMISVKAATKEFARLQKEVFIDLKLGMLHGKMKGKEKDMILEDFKNKKFNILVATPVVEVGIDISNATIMLIEASDRFGLSQLHQLRGRVGRGDKQSYCLLFSESQTPKTIERLKVMETIYTGPVLAEMDLKFRGAGEIYGTLQHGKKELKIANFSDIPLIEKTRRVTESVFKNLNEYPLLLEKVNDITLKRVSPD